MQYTSARIITKDHFSFQYGKVEARIKLPLGQGLWPAFWMLGDAISTIGWPSCGEIDIMEHVNNSPNASCAVHWNNNGHVFTGQQYTVDVTQFHTYGAIWTEDEIKCYIDGDIYYTFPIGAANGSLTEFQAPFFLLLNMTIGGNLPGSPDASTPFPSTMEVDYVRVYQNQPLSIESNEEASIKIIREPDSEEVVIMMDPSNAAKFYVHDVEGRIMLSGEINQSKQRINLAELPAGIYLLQVQSNAGENLFRLVKR
ncbi:MAG: family 16 glycosylhydrolase [Flavobacteriales bacterium]